MNWTASSSLPLLGIETGDEANFFKLIQRQQAFLEMFDHTLQTQRIIY